MLSVLRTAVPQQHSTSDTSRVKFRTVLGLGPLNKGFEPSRPKSSTSSNTQSRSLSRRSVDIVSGYSLKRRHRRNRPSVVDPFFYVPDEPVPAEHTAPTSEMKNSVSQSVPTQRVPVRAEKQDGPWAVSVAETPHEPNSYSIYIKSECLSVMGLSRAQSLPVLYPAPPSLTHIVVHAPSSLRPAFTSIVYMLTS